MNLFDTEILGLSHSAAADSNTAETAASGEALTPFPTRREMRAIHAAAVSVGPSHLPSRRDMRSANRRAPRRTVRRSAPAAVASPVFFAPSKRMHRSGLRTLFTVIAVGGLFASAGLPAYAFGTSGEVIASSGSTDVVSMKVSADAEIAGEARGTFTAIEPGNLAEQRSSLAKQANWDAYEKSGARDLGDDYPWFSELSNNQGGGLSPLNYFYRECVDFVAWRLNRDAGTTQAPFAYDWNSLTPGGGNASAWAGAWQRHGWPTSTTPKAGAVAWFAGNHVAYVKTVNKNGTVLIEEYNNRGQHKYGQRTIAATDVALYLYAPPR